MRAASVLLVATATACVALVIQACDPTQVHTGCKIYGTSCTCGYGCKSEYIYKTRRACLNSLKEMSSNYCLRSPCVRGICIQTAHAPGFTCKCVGTGYYGQRCDKVCPISPVYGLTFPHECVII